MQTRENYEKRLLAFMQQHTFPAVCDSDTTALKACYDALVAEGFLDILHVDVTQHEGIKQLLFSALCAKSGALGFLAVQHLAAYKIMHNGHYKHANDLACGIAINHLRAPKRLVVATKRGRHYYLNGTLRWASGFSIFDALVIGFHYEQYEMHALIDFNVQPGLNVSEKVQTFAANSMNTRNVELIDFKLDERAIIAQKEQGAYTQQKSLSKTVHYAFLGICQGALESCSDVTLETFALEQLQQFTNAIASCGEASTLLELRQQLFFFAQQLITTAMVQQGGAASLADASLQRLYRELMLFNANGLNADMKAQNRRAFLTSRFIGKAKG